MTDAQKAWLSTRPECVQRLAREFPLDLQLTFDGRSWQVMGYNEDDMLILAPWEERDYDKALAASIHVCASHFRQPGARRLLHAIRWQNGMVAAFDENGEQIPHLQGRYEDVREKVLAAATDETSFEHGIWNRGTSVVPAADW